jgi:hypothetical protein
VEARLFAGCREMPVASLQSLLDVAHTAVVLGHRVRWDPAARTLFVDSPLQGQQIACGYAENESGWCENAWLELTRRCGSAGAVVVNSPSGSGRFNLAIHLTTGLARGTGPMAEVEVRQRPWQRPRLGTIIAGYLQGATGMPVSLRSHVHLRRTPHMLVRLLLCQDEQWRQRLLLRSVDGLWRGVMRYFARWGEDGVDDDMELLHLQQEWAQPDREQPPAPTADVKAGREAAALTSPRPVPLYSWQWQRPLAPSAEMRGVNTTPPQ